LSKSIRWKKSARLAQVMRRVKELPPSVRRGAIEVVAIGVLAAIMLAAAFRGPSSASDDAAKAPRPGSVDAKNAASASLPTIPDPTTDGTAPAGPSASGAKDAPVTITGCLAQNADTFQLKDTTGADAPKARSWKTGFLKKRSAAVDVVDASKRLKLSNHVGERVSVTGILVDREMHGRSIRRVSASCASSKA
jgi:hypothetical protein